MTELIDRRQLKADAKELLAGAEVSPKGIVALYLALELTLSLLVSVAGGTGFLATFISILTSLLGMVLSAGFVLYCMAIRRGERAEYLTLFDGFSFVGKLIGLNIMMYILVWLWSTLFIIPGIIASYRYRFALYNLYENPGISIMEALDMSKRQTMGYKGQLFSLDISYLGWIALASVPAVAELALFNYQTLQYTAGYMGSTVQAIPVLDYYSALSPWLCTLIIGLWNLAVSLFYVADYQCVELGYFEIAKRTSGVGEDVSPQNPNPPWSNGTGPDGLGGF